MAKTDGLMMVSEFAKSRGVDRNAVTQYIRRHPELFDGHTVQEKQKLYFDDVAMDFLDKQYPLTQPVEVIKDTKSMELLILEQQKTAKLQEELIKIQSELQKAQLSITKNESERLLLEDKASRAEEESRQLKEKVDVLDQELKEKRDKLTETTVTLDFTQRELDQQKERAEAAEEELERARNASFWKRITGKW